LGGRWGAQPGGESAPPPPTASISQRGPFATCLKTMAAAVRVRE